MLKTGTRATAVTSILLCCAFMLALVRWARAEVTFDGMIWYDSHTPSTMSLNDDGQLEWVPYNDHQIIVRIPDQNLSDTGDVVEISYYWFSDGQGNIEGCDDCQNEATCNFNKDITCVSGTGDFRVGLFESDGNYITADGMGLTNDIFIGYKGYKFCMQPHVPQTPVKWREASDEPHIAGGFYERDMVDDARLMTVNEVFDRISMFGGYNLPLAAWSLWTIKLERISAGIEMSMTLNGITYSDIDTTDSPEIPQPQKIDVFAIDFANPNPYSIIVFDVPCEPGSANFNNDQVIDACDLAILADDWLKSDACLPIIPPDANGLVMYYSFDGPLGADVPTGLVDGTTTYTATIIAGTDADSSITYAAPNPTYNPGGTAAWFDNDNWADNAGDTFLIPDSGGLDFATFDAFTAALFINPSSAGQGYSRRLFSEYVYAYMYLTADNTLHAIRKWGPGDWDENRTHLTATVAMDEWSHVAMSWDADVAEDRFQLYVNAELAAAGPGTSTPTIDSTAGFAIGGYQRENGSTDQFFLGGIDEFALYDYALSRGEIAYFAAAGQPHINIPLESSANLHPDGVINLTDYALFALQWLDSC
ncbi:MAG: LamG domain-containing protein, partial [Planctomycetota bacterium]